MCQSLTQVKKWLSDCSDEEVELINHRTSLLPSFIKLLKLLWKWEKTLSAVQSSRTSWSWILPDCWLAQCVSSQSVSGCSPMCLQCSFSRLLCKCICNLKQDCTSCLVDQRRCMALRTYVCHWLLINKAFTSGCCSLASSGQTLTFSTWRHWKLYMYLNNILHKHLLHKHCLCASALYLYLYHSRSTVETPNETIQMSFCSHFSPISWCCVFSQLSHFIWQRLAPPAARAPAPRHRAPAADAAAQTSAGQWWGHICGRESNFHWAKSERMVQWIRGLRDLRSMHVSDT